MPLEKRVFHQDEADFDLAEIGTSASEISRPIGTRNKLREQTRAAINMKLDSFILFVIELADSIRPGVKSIRFQIDTSTDMNVTAANITVDDQKISLPNIPSHDDTFGLNFVVRVAGRAPHTDLAK